MNTPLVSVIIPNYNHARYLNERIDSILAQTYQNFEIIILDDCSTDTSREVIESYRNNPHVKQIVYNEKNSGNTFLQWEKGIRLAKGDFCYIAESDDYCRPQILEKLAGMFGKDDDVVLACCNTFFVNDEGAIYDGICSPRSPAIFDGKRFIGKYMAPMNYIRNAGMAMFRRDVARKIQPNFLKHKGAGDYIFWLQIAEHGKVGVLYEPLNFFRRHSGAITGKYDMDGSNLRAEKDIVDYICSRGYITEIDKAVICRGKINYIHSCNFNSENIKSELLQLWSVPDELQDSHKHKQKNLNITNIIITVLFRIKLKWYFKIRMFNYDKAARAIYSI